MSFDEYLKAELEKPINNEDYDANGNSNRAVVVRGLLGEIVWQYKAYPKRIMTELRCFDGLSTELGWFILLPLIILLSPVLPIFAGKHRYRRALNEYKARYYRTKTRDY